ncbi:aldehyde dehydrogenase family protein [Pseudonocardia eucalypti]|uniref:Aldehyde dehydrogenase n=1 Tax=Pseudonocardia eucalypti TaxID=648755 RepID=A0ABP9PCL0_9PSEU|nr:acyl-CoA reductase-like NAD-dependent aldehyde dehydrogenase [Pseudonocardia eucalypti]
MTTTQSGPITHDAGETFEVRSPIDGSVAARLPLHGPDHVAAAAARLRAAQPAWEDLGPKQRCKYLLQWLDWIMDNERRLLDLVQKESGKSWGDTSFESVVAVQIINYVAKHAPKWLADVKVKPDGLLNKTKRLKVHARPYPLVGVITPWNFPLTMPLLDIPFALAAGAAVLSKPSEVTPLAWSEAARGWQEIGAPHVLECVTGLGATGAAVVDQVDMIQFTGSTRTGRAIAVRAAERLIPASLELGGKDAMIVLDDADLDRAVNGAVWGGLFNAGQVCISVERLYVHEGIYDEFVSRVSEKVAAIRQGTDTDHSFTNDIGAMATPAQVDIVDKHVQDALAKGARVLTGGTRGEVGNYYAPTVLVDVDHNMACMTEETFGPTLPIMKVGSEEEAVRLANDSPYGLAGSVWSRDAKRAEALAKRLDTGGVTLNNALTGVAQMGVPFGGWKSSGMGARNGGAYSVRKYTRQQALVGERVAMKSEMNWYPTTPENAGKMAKAVRLLGMHDWRRRFGKPAR